MPCKSLNCFALMSYINPIWRQLF